MTASTNQTPGAKCRRPILIALIAVSALSFIVHARPGKERLLKKMTECLREERFEELYEEAGDNVSLNVSKEKFVRRMKAAADKMKAIDPELNFKPDAIMESIFQDDELLNGRSSVLISTAKTLEGNGKSVSVLIHWNIKGEFFDLSVLPDRGTPEEFNVYGVSYTSRTIGGKVIED